MFRVTLLRDAHPWPRPDVGGWRIHLGLRFRSLGLGFGFGVYRDYRDNGKEHGSYLQVLGFGCGV